jgi:predicted ATPase/DNA-binding CsgD family transcriptional regulator
MPRSDPEELSPREIDVLAAIERRLTNSEIADDLCISVRTVESHVASLRRKLGVDSRSKLIAAARGRRATVVELPQNSFVGRDEDLHRLRELLDTHRWVTIVGPPGCGKTRLALELAAADARAPLVADMEHATVDNAVNSVAQAIGVAADRAAELTAACGVALRAQNYLLVIDDCDRVTDPVAEVVRELMARAPSVTVLATSRSPLGRTDETVYQLEPLPVADDADAAAVRLFIDRARSAAPAVRFTAADVESIARMCRRLDGLPLSIELAAARVRHLTVDELARRLDEGFGLLDRQGAPNRHRTLESAFDWTWDLLDDDERLVLAQLAALPRSFDLELAEAVTTTTGAARVVLRLLDRSLLSQAIQVSEPRRFRLLHSLRHLVLERADPFVVTAARRAHAESHARHAAELANRIRTDDSRRLVDEAKRIAPEVAAAIDWATANQVDLAVSQATSLAELLEHGGPDLDSLATIARAARTPAIRQTATTTELCEIGNALIYGDLDLLAEVASVALSTAADDRSRLAAHRLAGWADAFRGRTASAISHLDLAEPLAIEHHDLGQLASIRQARGQALRIDDPAAAIAMFESAAETYALAGDAMHVNNCRYMMAIAAADTGHRCDEALAWIAQCEAWARASGNQHELAHARITRVALTPEREHEDTLVEAVDTFRAIGDLRCLTRCYLLLAARRSTDEQIPLLEHALATATDARDDGRRATALERLIAAHWKSDAHRLAATALGALVDLVGNDTATSRCPVDMRDHLERWHSAIAEGRARGYRPATEDR